LEAKHGRKKKRGEKIGKRRYEETATIEVSINGGICAWGNTGGKEGDKTLGGREEGLKAPANFQEPGPTGIRATSKREKKQSGREKQLQSQKKAEPFWGQAMEKQKGGGQRKRGLVKKIGKNT